MNNVTILRFINDDWDGIDSGLVTFETENGKLIYGVYDVEECTQEKIIHLWTSEYGKNYLADSKLEIDGILYNNMWDYILNTITPKFYTSYPTEEETEIRIDDYVITD